MKNLLLIVASWLLLCLPGTAQEPATAAEPIRTWETLKLSEWDGLRHVTAADPKQLRALLEQSEGWLPWDPVLFLEPPLVIWTDFSRLPQELAGLPKQWGQDRYGVKFRGLQVRVNLDPPVEELWGQWAFTWEWLPDQAAAKRYADLICRQFGLKALTPAAYERLLREPRNWWLQPRLLTLSVWVADLAEQEAYAQNIAAEIAAWEAEEKLARSKAPGQGGVAEDGVSSDSAASATGMAALDGGGQRMSLLLLGGGCPITNEAAPFGMDIAVDTNGWMVITWQSCPDHVYSVRTTEELSFTNAWTPQAWLIGQDGTTSWTDTNAPALSHRFYRVHRAARANDSDGDGMPDGWELDHGLNPVVAGDASLPSDIPWANGTNNLAAYHLSLIPPVITAVLDPAVNSNGWNKTDVTVSFQASSVGSGIEFVSPPVVLSGETNDCEVLGLARDHAGNEATVLVAVNIDHTPPVVTLAPGSGQTNDQSHPLLVVDYADGNPGVGSGLDMASLRITLNGVDVTATFYPFSNQALATTNLAFAVSNVWSATIADYAGNAVTSTVCFTSTGTTNPAAPVLSELNLTNSVTVLPDVPEVWVQGKISGQQTTVSAQVNGGESVAMNRRSAGNDFGYLLPLEPGTNVIVLVAADAGASNLNSRVLLVERSEKFRAEITSPAFGSYAEGQSNVVSGYVSAQMNDGTTNAPALVAVRINGLTTTLSGVDTNGNVAFTGDTALPPGDGPQAITGTVVWSDGQVTQLPPGYRNDYEVVRRESETRSVWPLVEDPFAIRWGEGGYCWPNWVMGSVAHVVSTNVYGLPDASGWTTVETVAWKYREPNGDCTSDPENDQTVWGNWTNGCPYGDCIESNSVPVRSLAFGSKREAWYEQTWNDAELLWPWTETTDASLTFRAPMHYPTNQVVVFTFEGMQYGRPEGATQDLSQVQFIFNGQTNTPVAVSNEIQSVSYLISVDGAKEYTVTTNSFLWPTTSTNWVEVYVDPYDPFWDSTTWYTNTYHTLSWTNFHNEKVEWVIKRNYESQAEANGSRFETVDALAKEIHLEASEYTLWLEATDDKGLPSSTSEKFSEPRKFKIPNEVHITQGDSTKVFDYLLYKKDFLIKKRYKSKPNQYKVVDHFITGLSKYDGQSRDEVKNVVNTSSNICIWAHFGHGSIVNGKAGNLFFMEDLDSLAPSDFHPLYKLAEIVLLSCEAGKKDSEWLNHVAKGGKLYSTPEDITAWPYPLFWLTPSYWSPYQPLTGKTKE